MASRLKLKGRRESGRFAGIPVACMDHENFISLSMPAKVLLMELCRQYNGYNNGDLCASFSVMHKRGYRSKGTLNRALKELREKDWVQLSRFGWRNKCSLYALTFHAIDDCKGKLDIQPTTTAPGTWKKLDSAPPMCTNVPRMCTSDMN
ncbi:MAG: helix-turn-helix domain-containing protein [Gammaproteobacteria bacterium]|nr:helix-turn-helix domain-containing protein [Gammaproteobacteria bacterium]